MAAALFTLVMLIFLQAVLGFDNLLYISLESKRAPEDKQSYVRTWGIGIAIVLRIVLLFILVSLIPYLQKAFISVHQDFFTAEINAHSLIVLLGGVFIIYTAIKEIWHMISIEDDHTQDASKKGTVASVMTMIIIMNLVFSFDSILSAIALANELPQRTGLIVMTIAIVISGILMIWLSERVTTFLKKNRMYEVLGLFVLFIVGIMLITEGGHLAHISFFGNPIEPMSKATFYFVIFVLVIVDVVQGRYQRKLVMEKEKKYKDVAV